MGVKERYEKWKNDREYRKMMKEAEYDRKLEIEADKAEKELGRLKTREGHISKIRKTEEYRQKMRKGSGFGGFVEKAGSHMSSISSFAETLPIAHPHKRSVSGNMFGGTMSIPTFGEPQRRHTAHKHKKSKKAKSITINGQTYVARKGARRQKPKRRKQSQSGYSLPF